MNRRHDNSDRLQVLERSLQRILARNYRGWIVAVEPRSGRYFVGRVLLEALEQARKAFTRTPLFFLRVGSTYAHQRHGMTLP